jgi:DNA-directed RNA polymerase subunit RPC12/RpoP
MFYAYEEDIDGDEQGNEGTGVKNSWAVDMEKEASLNKKAIGNEGLTQEEIEDEKKQYQCPSCETEFTGRKYSPARMTGVECPTCRSKETFIEIGNKEASLNKKADVEIVDELNNEKFIDGVGVVEQAEDVTIVDDKVTAVYKSDKKTINLPTVHSLVSRGLINRSIIEKVAKGDKAELTKLAELNTGDVFVTEDNLNDRCVVMDKSSNKVIFHDVKGNVYSFKFKENNSDVYKVIEQ